MQICRYCGRESFDGTLHYDTCHMFPQSYQQPLTSTETSQTSRSQWFEVVNKLHDCLSVVEDLQNQIGTLHSECLQRALTENHTPTIGAPDTTAIPSPKHNPGSTALEILGQPHAPSSNLYIPPGAGDAPSKAKSRAPSSLEELDQPHQWMKRRPES